MTQDSSGISFPDDGKKDFDLEGIIIEPATNQANDGNGATPSSPTPVSPKTDAPAHASDELLEESGIEILRGGKSLDLDDPDLA
ncbi:MAG: hypothetical protein A2675_02625 [Candidatus Yonathbacteria bacterium RIFCSPHIGHO2_01_FULL_51_10]|uniref:Uncharacterized protein n=1 Tax=Candidatus Yonathbacteria bacterium RIFCSPHIGHO2_01_FULL_51_10 TaxID=1802723 RepID=A0A1G2S3D4_9BACT|nr:MAG: hypothetical protein A2675_02625 [Candidatus Yonathbacteria bacterium RIFCSPHIGHO2_01_FULL_51_10]